MLSWPVAAVGFAILLIADKRQLQSAEKWDNPFSHFKKAIKSRCRQSNIVSEKRNLLISSLKSGAFIIMAETNKTYEIRVVKKVLKNLLKLPENIRERFTALAEQLRECGPVAHDWPNYSKLGDSRYHCHLTRS